MRSVLGWLALAATLGMSLDARGPTFEVERPIVALRAFEASERAHFDFTNPPSSETGLGADPWSIARMPSERERYVGILRGRSAVVLLDQNLHELSRAVAPRSTTGLAVDTHGAILVSGELSNRVVQYDVHDDVLVEKQTTTLDDAVSIRDVAWGPGGTAYALDALSGRLVALVGARRVEVVACRGASQVTSTSRHVLVDCPSEHAIVSFRVDEHGVPRADSRQTIRNDGPFWGFDAHETATGLLVVAGGIENHPLDRSGGFFGNVDSFVFGFLVTDASVTPLFSTNVSEQGVVTPKAVSIASDTPLIVVAAGYGSSGGVRLSVDPRGGVASEKIVTVPGARTLTRAADGAWLSPNPLIDAWTRTSEDDHTQAVPVAGEPKKSGTPVELGEALLFTTLMAPRNSSDGSLSRFSCEACHFEGVVDGRRHHTGRADIRVVTKPLLGLGSNRPYFSRALDPDLSAVAMGEFRVATAGNHYDPWFELTLVEEPWLRHLGIERERIPPEDLRRAFMAFLMAFSQRPNPYVIGRDRWTVLERRGAEVFLRDCAACHAARLVADDPESVVSFQNWEKYVLSDAGPIVWGSSAYQRTGIEPYVHSEGARTPSLRRLYAKKPYFTNGSADELIDILSRARIEPAAFTHAGEKPDARALTEEEKKALLAFLRLI